MTEIKRATAPPEDQYVTALEVAKVLGVTRHRVYQMLGEGKFPGAKRLGSWIWLIPRAEAAALRAARHDVAEDVINGG